MPSESRSGPLLRPGSNLSFCCCGSSMEEDGGGGITIRIYISHYHIDSNPGTRLGKLLFLFFLFQNGCCVGNKISISKVQRQAGNLFLNLVFLGRQTLCRWWRGCQLGRAFSAIWLNCRSVQSLEASTCYDRLLCAGHRQSARASHEIKI